MTHPKSRLMTGINPQCHPPEEVVGPLKTSARIRKLLGWFSLFTILHEIFMKANAAAVILPGARRGVKLRGERAGVNNVREIIAKGSPGGTGCFCMPVAHAGIGSLSACVCVRERGCLLKSVGVRL